MWPRGASVASLGGARASRHAAPSRSHILAKVLRQTRATEFIVFPFQYRFGRSVVQGALSTEELQCLAALADSTRLAARITDTPPNIMDVDKFIEGALSTEVLQCLAALADSTRLAARITDTPPNIMDVDKFIEEAFTIAAELDLPEPTVIRGEELRERGMGGLYGVGAAAERPPALVALSHRPPGATASVAWVGKGIASMVGMKGDCGGAAAVLAAFAAFVKAKPTINVHAVLCRLVLSDGVVYASRDLKADTIVDVATLTGAQLPNGTLQLAVLDDFYKTIQGVHKIVNI
ncbi:putative aminopeptidase NPEPL1 [Operophtera brumata]|uniref:Putative aminopeptidase NPEPL1 n=1 Tax=Operophtera brumata TaxID=104452 RepID=A0A0L7L9A5_OPEBR|nr:putative aminopeptidase NPEPL1 [Operophtera brumata]